MKDEQSKTAAAATAGKPSKGRNRTVKVSDNLHHRARVISVQRRIPMQHFIEEVLDRGIRRYEKLDSKKAAA
jgi:hypothetical protein